MIAIICFWAAQKIDSDRSSSILSVSDVLKNLARDQQAQCTAADVVNLEQKLVIDLKWNLMIPTSYDFLFSFLRELGFVEKT